MREKIGLKFWKPFWIFAPLVAIILLPFGSIITYVLGLVGFEGIGRLNQALIMFSVLYGFFIGIIILFLANKLEFRSNLTNKIKWLARFAIITPILTVLVMFLLFSR